jgi:hypothetical protein
MYLGEEDSRNIEHNNEKEKLKKEYVGIKIDFEYRAKCKK